MMDESVNAGRSGGAKQETAVAPNALRELGPNDAKEPGRSAQYSGALSPGPIPRPRKILIIEDETPLRETLRWFLEARAYVVLEAPNGETGLRVALVERPHLILSDIDMHPGDGFEVLKRLREQEGFRSVPFIFMTAKSEDRYWRKGMELGADDFLSKPFSSENLFRALEGQLR